MATVSRKGSRVKGMGACREMGRRGGQALQFNREIKAGLLEQDMFRNRFLKLQPYSVVS